MRRQKYRIRYWWLHQVRPAGVQDLLIGLTNIFLELRTFSNMVISRRRANVRWVMSGAMAGEYDDKSCVSLYGFT